MSTPTPSCAPLKSGINLGQNFTADDGSFLCPIQSDWDGFSYIGFVENKDVSCEFFVEKFRDGIVRLKDHRGFYLRRTDCCGRFPIEAKQMTPDGSCEFKLFTRNGKVIFQGDNGLFLSRILSGLYGGVNTLEAAKQDADVFCEFLPEGLTVSKPETRETSVCHPLEPGISLGLSFKADNQGFWCTAQNEDGFMYIGFMENRDPNCQFFVENLCNGKVQIKDSKGFYLRRTDRCRRFPIEAKQMTPDASCEFKLFTRNGNVIFQGDNGLFLSRIFSGLYGGVNTLEAVKKEADECCEFLPEGLTISKSAPTTLEPPGVSLGLSFKGDDTSFLCPVQNEDGFMYIGFTENRDPICQFFVENLCNGKVQIKDNRGFHLRRTDRCRRFPIEAKQMTPDASCEFKLFTRNGKVIFQGDNGLFLSRIFSGLYGGVNTLEAVKKEADECCEFLPEVMVKICGD